MVMFVLFAVLFVYEMAERDVREAFFDPGADVPPPDDLRGGGGLPVHVYEQSAELAREADLEDVQVTLEADRSVRVAVRGPLLFDLGRAELRPPTRTFLARLADVLRTTESSVVVIGHTDSFPVASERFPTNWELSAFRATAVVRFLIDQGLEPERFSISGHGMYRPEVPNDSPQNKARNRRVEILITGEPFAPRRRS